MPWPFHFGTSLALTKSEEQPELEALMLENITRAVKQKFFPSATPAESPSSVDLGRHFEKFVQYWADAEYQYLGPIRDDRTDLPVEVSIRWKGEVGGRIVIRCRSGFLKWLEE